MSEESDGEQKPLGQQPSTTVPGKEGEQSRSDDREVAKRKRNKEYFAALNCEQVLELLDALKMSKYKQAFAEKEMDGDLLINGCDDDELKDSLGVASKIDRRKLMRLITGEFSAEDIFKDKPTRLKHPPKSENDDPMSGDNPSPSAAQERGRVEDTLHTDSERTLKEHFRPPVRDEMTQDDYEILSVDDIRINIESGIPDTSFSSCGTPKGLTAPPERTITIYFHILLATEAWQWDDSISRAHIRFGHRDLGNWEVNCGEATWSKELDETLMETVFTLPIDKSILENGAPLPYTYAIYSGTLEAVKSPLEHLYDAPHHPMKSGEEDSATRCLVIPPRNFWKNEFHQFDTICYPSPPKSGDKAEKLTQIFIKALNKFRHKSLANTSYSVPSPELMLKRCLEAYLTDHHNKLTGYDISEAVVIDKTIDEIMHIYNCLSNRLLHYRHSNEYGTMPAINIEKLMQDWLLQASRRLKGTIDQKAFSSKHLISAAVIILCLRQLSRDCLKSLPIRAMRSLLEIVTLTPSEHTRQCSDYENLCKYILITDRPLLSKAVYTLCSTVMKSKGSEAVEWFQALPLHHFLEGYVQPFGELNLQKFLELEFKKDYSDLRKATDTEAKHTDSNSDEGVFDKYYVAIKHLLEADPLLAELFIYICPTGDLRRLFSLVSPYLAVIGVAKLLRDFLPRSPLQNATVLFKTIIDGARISALSAQTEHISESYQEKLQLIKACQWVFMEVIEKLQSTAQHCVELVNAAVCLVLHGLHCISQLKDANSEKQKQVMFQKLSTSLKAWVSNYLSVSALKNPKLAKAKEDIKLWDTFLQLDCPKELQNEWEHAADGIMKERIDQVDDVMKVNLVCVPELDSPHTHTCTTRNLEVAAAHALQAMDPVMAIRNAEKILSSRSMHVNTVFKILIEERYEKTTLCLSDLLEWKLWPCLIKHFGSNSGYVGPGVMENPKMMSSLAHFKMGLFHDKIQDGTITIQDLEDIRENREHMKQLLSAASIKKPMVERRLEQLEYIQTYQKQLCNFYLHHRELENEGILELRRDADTDISLERLRDVIDIESHPPQYKCLTLTLHLRKYFEEYYVLSVEHSSDLFMKFWQERIEKKTQRRELAVLVEQVWQSTFDHCDKVISSLQKETMKTTEVEELFKEKKEDTHIQQEITQLYHGFNKCRKRNGNDVWIERVVKRILIHRSLQKYSEAAKSFLHLATCLNLTGEFREVKLLSDQMSQAAKRRCLSDINQEIIEAGNSLKAIAEDPENLQCLQAFVECQSFRAWLVDAFKDVADLRNFASVAVATGIGGEDELALQKFSDLELVGSAFGPLLYDLKEDSGSDALFAAWERVWNGAKKTKLMKEILVDLNKEIEWFKEVKKGHGSVESTSYGQMDASMKFGVYHIGTAKKQLLQSSKALRIEICPKDEHRKPLQAKPFTLEQLRDLESRLVLMGGSSSTSQDGVTEVTQKEKGKKAKIEEFLKVFRKVCQVADLLVELQHEGHVKYIGWHYSFPCSSKHVSGKLQELAEEMKDDLMMWKEEVTNQRQQFYELNYYTTLQLLQLRQELCNTSTCFDSTVLVQLASISPKVQHCNVTEAVQCVTSRLKSQHSGSPSTSQSTQKPDNENYLGLPELGLVLKKLGEQLPAPVSKSRQFPIEFLQVGSPNLLIIHPDDVLKTVISIYMRDESLPLPTMEEVLLCTDATAAEEVILLWRRAVYDPGYRRIFCLVNPEKLSYNVADTSFRELNQILQVATKEKKRHDYRLVIVCGSESTQRSHAVSKLEKYQRPYCEVTDKECHDYLRNHYIKSSGSNHAGISKSRVRAVKSKHGGLGKSFYIQRMTEMFPRSRYIIIPIHGPVVTADIVMEQLKDHGSELAIFHIDIAPSVLHKVDTVLFKLLILGGLSDSQGRVWRCNLSQKFAVEITETPKKGIAASFLRMIPTVECISPEQHLKPASPTKLAQCIAPLDAVEFHSPSFQRVYQYLRRYDYGDSLDGFMFQNTAEGTIHQCLQILTMYCGQKNPSWSEIKHFVHFLDQQMKSCEKSVYVNFGGCPGFKHFVVKFMITMSKDFATSSLRCELDQEQPCEPDPLKRYEIDTRRKWEQSAHPYLIFNEDGHSITFVGFKISIEDRDLLHPETSAVLIRRAVTPELLEFLKLSGVDLDEQWKDWSKVTMITKLATVMGIRVDPTTIYDPDVTYELTTDNLIKMLAIQMRFRSNIPVILMGETGCGKTRLIKYMCALAKQGKKLKTFFMLKVHGGTTDAEILRVIQKADKEVPKNMEHNVYTVVFFDEANTTEALSLIKEIMCDHRAYGKKIPDNIKLVAACNPYRRHTEEMIANLKSAGLGFHVDVQDTKDRFGDIPLRELVYRVLDLPPSMRPLVYDFGQLSPKAEKDYVHQIVHNHVVQTLSDMRLTGSETLASISAAISHTLSWCQSYMRQKEDECSFVSLRDVERTMMVFDYFYKKMDMFAPEIKKQSRLKSIWPIFGARNLLPECQALVLAISVCYNSRLRNRDDFETRVVKQLQDTKCKRLDVPGDVKQFRKTVAWYQDIFLDNMRIGSNIARNKALKENIFMMVVCIELRIPLFVVGKPGSSKSLAKTIVHDSMAGQASDSKLMKDLKQVHMFSYQCSQLSTSESIIQVFKKAKEYQSKQNMEHFVSVVVLDEVGLAEDSPSLPLKALHPLLEDGTAGADDSEEVVPLKERVAFIGISNWALDPAKMNRGIMVTRTDPDTKELVRSAKGICSNEENDPVRERLKSYFVPLAEAYQEIVTNQNREFYGLRDFYSLIKMLYWKCKTLDRPLTPSDLQYAIRRNFDGFGKFDTLSCFYRKLKFHNLTDASCSDIVLMKDSLSSRETSWHGENRYLLLLTENYAALTAILSVLHDSDSEIEPYVLFGSGFPRDKEFTQVCCNISRIKHCMQTGRTVILLNLENLYESLYDLLNQYYTEHGGHRFVDLGLQCHRMKCQVHKNFKVIVIAEEETVYEHFPTPLINRLEKHRIVMESILEPWKFEILREFRIWIEKFTRVTTSRSTEFRPEDAFVGYHKDIPATVLYHAFEVLKLTTSEEAEQEKSFLLSAESDERISKCKEDVLKRSKYFLLQTAAPDALIRLKKTGVSEEEQQELMAYYFKSQQHSSLTKFLFHQLIEEEPMEPLFMQVTTHSHLPSSIDYENISKELDGMNIVCLYLQEFGTELDFTNKLSNIIRVSVYAAAKPAGESDSKSSEAAETESVNVLTEGDSDPVVNGDHIETPQHSEVIIQAYKPSQTLIVVQCDAAFTDGSLIACGRYRIYDVVNEEAKRAKDSADRNGGLNFRVHILYVIHVPRRIVNSSFTGFQPRPWVSYHIDSLLPSFGELPLQLDQMQNTPLSELFRATSDRLCSLIPVASSIVHDPADSKRSTWRLKVLIAMIPKQFDTKSPADKEKFHGALTKHVHSILEQHDEEVYSEREWILNEALSPRQLQRGGTLQSALYGKLDDIIVPILAEIIAFIDRNYNLSSSIDPDSANLWLNIFSNLEICKFKYRELFPERLGKQRQEVPGIGGRRCSTDFQCKFPFSWIVKESLDALLNQALHLAGSRVFDLHAQVCRMIEQSPIGDVLKEYSVSKSSAAQLLENGYLHDFIRMGYAPKHNAENENQLLIKAIDRAAQHLYQDSLVSRLAAVHVVFHTVRKEILWFGQLVTVNPKILKPMMSVLSSEEMREMVLHLIAVGETLEILDTTIPLKQGVEAQKSTYVWLQSVYACQRAVNSALHLPVNTPQSKELILKLSLKWQRQQAVQLFIEYFVIQHPNLVSYARKLNETLAGSSDFTKVFAIKAVFSVLNSLSNDHKQRRHSTATCNPSWIPQTSYTFFTEVVSNLCFGWAVPEDEVINKLMSIAFPEASSHQPYGMTAIRPFLLHLLLKQDFQKCESYLADYFKKLQPQGERNHDILLQCVQGLEDSYHQQMSELPHIRQIQETLKHTKEAHADYKSGSSSAQTLSSLRSVRAVARLRFSLTFVARTLSGLIEDDRVGTSTLDDHSGVLLQAAKEVCTDVSINEVDTGPAVFLAKQIMKRYGAGCFMALATSEEYSWVLPERLYPPEENKGVDPFVIYGQPYSDIRKGVSSLVKGIGFGPLDSSLKRHEQRAVLLQLAIYKRVTLMSRKKISKDVVDKFGKFIGETVLLSAKDKEMCLKLLRNNLPAASHLNVTKARSHREKILGEIVLHAVLILTGIKDLQILQPFVAMLQNPGSLQNCYLPTMPEDALTEARKAISAAFYECPRGHPYLITECGRPVTKGNCSECGLPIGGLNYQLSTANKKLEEGHDNTRSGYLLQKPSPRSKAPLSIRGLSPTSCLIMRILMHSALLWASASGNEACIRGLQQIMRTSVKDNKLPDFFWNHLLRDIQLLHEDTGKSIDDAALLVHLVLQTITTKSNPRAPAVTSAQVLISSEARAQWETDFTVTCIQPVLQSLDERLKLALDSLSEDAKEEKDMLFVVVNEMTSTDGNLTHHLWSYRPQITLGHLQQLLQQMDMQKQCPILNQFLIQEPSLRATKYLPEIVQLQYRLYDKYNYRMDQKVAQTTTVAQFLRDVKSSSEELWKTYRYLILECLNKAWRLVREELPQHARLRVDGENLMPEVTLETKLDYLIPTTSGHGICTTALVDYLVQTHNTFIERCQAVAQEKQKRKFDWKKLEVPITHINHCHLIDHEEQLYPIILSHCQYSLKAGHGQEVQYDFAGLEKHILKRFIFGKPTILLDIPQVAYQKDVYASVTFQRVREVIHQEPMPSEMKGRVLRDEWTNQQLRKTTDVLEVALGFMSSGAGSAKMSLCSFVQDTLQMKLDSSIKLPDCSLEHTISLWRVLSVKLCKTLTLANEEPFDVEGKDLLQELSEQQIRDLDAALERFNLNQLLESLLEFTLIFVKYMSTDQLQGWPIAGTLEPFLDNQGLPEIPNFEEKFPGDILIGQTIAVWKHIVHFQKNNTTHIH